MYNYEKFQNGIEAVDAGISLLGLGIGGIRSLVNTFKYEKCKIFIRNNHCHNISVVLDLPEENKIKGWYNFEPGECSRIHTTKRRTYKVGIHAKCNYCGATWGDLYSKFIPDNGQPFEIESNDNRSWGRGVNFFVNNDDLSKKEDYTFIIQ